MKFLNTFQSVACLSLNIVNISYDRSILFLSNNDGSKWIYSTCTYILYVASDNGEGVRYIYTVPSPSQGSLQTPLSIILSPGINKEIWEEI